MSQRAIGFANVDLISSFSPGSVGSNRWLDVSLALFDASLLGRDDRLLFLMSIKYNKLESIQAAKVDDATGTPQHCLSVPDPPDIVSSPSDVATIRIEEHRIWPSLSGREYQSTW